MRHRRQLSNKADTGIAPRIAPRNFKPRRKLGEKPLNNQLLRIHLLREDLNTLKVNKTNKKPTVEATTRSKRLIIKRHLSFPPSPRSVKPIIPATPKSVKPIIPPTPKSVKSNTLSKTNKNNKPPEKPETTAFKPLDKSKNVANKAPVKSNKTVDKPIAETPKPSEKPKPQPRRPIRITLTQKPAEKQQTKEKNHKAMNGTTFFPDMTNKMIKIYYIKYPLPAKRPEGKLLFKFTQLVNDVKTMQLPTPTWKIKVIIKTQKISAVVFTNKADIERSVTFTADRDTYDIVFDNRPAILLGAPDHVTSSKEIEVMLQVLEQLDKDSPMVLFK